MQDGNVEKSLLQSDSVLLTGFRGQLSAEYNIRHDRPKGIPPEKHHLIAWLVLRAGEDGDADGLSVLESQILRHRKDVHDFVLEDGAINVCRLRLWAITHGVHELGLDGEILADTIEHALSLTPNRKN